MFIKTISVYKGHVPYPVRSLAWSPDCRCIVSGGEDDNVRVWQVQTAQEITHMEYTPLEPLSAWDVSDSAQRTSHSAWVNTVTWSSNGQYIASGSDDCMIHLWSADSAQLIMIDDEHSSGIMAMAFSPNDHWIASAADCRIRVWDALLGSPSFIYGGHELHTGGVNYVFALGWSLDGQYLASGGDDGTVRIWQIIS